jgi:hypothetical protein
VSVLEVEQVLFLVDCFEIFSSQGVLDELTESARINLISDFSCKILLC